MAETSADVLVAGYPDIGGAAKDVESLGALVRDTQVSIGGVILLTHAPDGIVAVRQPRSRGVGAGGRAGLAVGLFAPPPRASVAVGAVAGGVIREFVGYRVEQDIPGHSDS